LFLLYNVELKLLTSKTLHNIEIIILKIVKNNIYSCMLEFSSTLKMPSCDHEFWWKLIFIVDLEVSQNMCTMYFYCSVRLRSQLFPEYLHREGPGNRKINICTELYGRFTNRALYIDSLFLAGAKLFYNSKHLKQFSFWWWIIGREAVYWNIMKQKQELINCM
jgi:hypothetical protein